jgi:drug/metabolite transporter (DMT)-like permease
LKLTIERQMTPSTRKIKAKPKALTTYLIIAAVLQIVWGLVPSASKLVIDEIPVELYIALRWTISGAIFAAYLFFTKTWRPVPLKTVGLVALLGVLGYALGSFGTLYSLKIGGVTNFALMTALSPAITTVIAIIVLRERPSKLFFFALPLSIMGLLLLAWGKSQLTTTTVAIVSALWLIFADICEAIVFVYSKKFKSAMGAPQYLAIAQIAGALGMWLAQAVWFHQLGQITQLSAQGLTAAIFVSVVACVLCFSVLYWLLDHVDGHRLSLFDGVHALSATTFGLLFFHEKLKPLMIAGGSLILIGLLIGNFAKGEETPE